MKHSDLQPGDILLYRPRTPIGYLIAWWTRSEYCHAAMIGVDGTVMEMYSLRGGRVSEIADQRIEPIDVYLPQVGREVPANAAAEMLRIVAARKYGTLEAILAGIRCRLPRPLRWLFGRSERDGSTHCSGAISEAYRRAGFDLCPFIADWVTTPEHIARSAGLKNLRRLEF